MSKITLLTPLSINGDTATSVTMELRFTFTDTFRVYYTYYNDAGTELFYGGITVPRNIIDNNTEDNIIIQTSWQVNNIQYLGGPTPMSVTTTGLKAPQSLSFIYELYEPYIVVDYITTNQIKGQTIIPGTTIDSNAVSTLIAAFLNISVGEIVFVTEDGSGKFVTEDQANTFTKETPATQNTGVYTTEDGTQTIYTEDGLNPFTQ